MECVGGPAHILLNSVQTCDILSADNDVTN